MIIFYSAIVGLLNWVLFVSESKVQPCAISSNGINPIPVIATENRSSDEPYYLEYDDFD